MRTLPKKDIFEPDENRTFDQRGVALVSLGGTTFGRAVLQPGWTCFTCVKALANTNGRQAPHLQHHLSGRRRVVMDARHQESSLRILARRDGDADAGGPRYTHIQPLPGQPGRIRGPRAAGCRISCATAADHAVLLIERIA